MKLSNSVAAVALLCGLVFIRWPSAAQQPPAPKKTAAVAPEFADIDALLKSLPSVTVPGIDADRAAWFATVPLGCLDELQAKPASRAYFWEGTFRTTDGYDKTRAFYGCSDWHSAVNATWVVVKLLKQYPDLPINAIVREKLTDHLGKSNLEGELAYFKEAGQFERPYGYAWLLKLYAELMTWNDPDGEKWTANMAPLARFFSESLVPYLTDLERPNRTATQANTAFALNLALDYTGNAHDSALQRAIEATAKRFYASATNCATDTEAVSPELVSPCLAEAALMARVMESRAYGAWLDAFLPPVFSPKFKPLTTLSLAATGPGRRGRSGNAAAAPAAVTPSAGAAPPASAAPPPPPAQPPAGAARPPEAAGAADVRAEQAQNPPDRGPGGRSGRGGAPVNPRLTWGGLAFARAQALDRMATALPPGDKRVAVFRRLAAIHAQKGMEAASEPAAMLAPWLGAYALNYVFSAGSAR